MTGQWPSKKDQILRGMNISPESKLEGCRLMNELADKVLSTKQKALRRKQRIEK
jgi:hypothetical protein